MQIKTFRAGSMQEALHLVRQSLGPDAAVLQTREVGSGVLRWLKGHRQVEVVASADVPVPSRLPESVLDRQATDLVAGRCHRAGEAAFSEPAITDLQEDFRDRFLRAAEEDFGEVPSLVEGLTSGSDNRFDETRSSQLRVIEHELRELDLGDTVTRKLIERVRITLPYEHQESPEMVRAAIAAAMEDMIRVSGPIRTTPATRRVVALVGPTGVGKTTSIAKLAAAFRLHQSCHVGLITLDTYRVAAVEQVRMYADILDLPIEVASTPGELRTALARLAESELVLVDTAGRSPSDREGLRELQSLLAEAAVNDVQLVLSLVAGRTSLTAAASAFAGVGATSLLLTKLDEATHPGSVLELQHDGGLPISYITDGQKVPDDIQPADPRWLSRRILGAGFDRLQTAAAQPRFPLL